MKKKINNARQRKGKVHLLRACEKLVPIPYNWNQNIKKWEGSSIIRGGR